MQNSPIYIDNYKISSIKKDLILYILKSYQGRKQTAVFTFLAFWEDIQFLLQSEIIWV